MILRSECLRLCVKVSDGDAVYELRKNDCKFFDGGSSHGSSGFSGLRLLLLDSNGKIIEPYVCILLPIRGRLDSSNRPRMCSCVISNRCLVHVY